MKLSRVLDQLPSIDTARRRRKCPSSVWHRKNEHDKVQTPHCKRVQCWHSSSKSPELSHLDHQVALVDNTVVGESSHGGDVLGGHVKVSGGRVRGLALDANLVDLLVDLGTVVEASLAGTGDGPLDAGRVP